MLTRYKLVGVQGIGALKYQHATYQLDQLTDKDCDILDALGLASPYIVKLETAPAAPEQELSKPPAAEPAPTESEKEPAPAQRKRKTPKS